MFCPNCGKEIQMDALFCGNCGFSVADLKVGNNEQEKKESESAPVQPTIEFTPAQTVPAQNCTQIHNDVVSNVQPAAQYADDNSTLITVIKVFLIIGCVAQGWLIIPLAWCIPMTVVLFKKMNNGLSIGMGLKICTLLFVNLISGICLLCLKDERR